MTYGKNKKNFQVYTIQHSGGIYSVIYCVVETGLTLEKRRCFQRLRSGKNLNSKTLEKIAKAAGISKDDLYPGKSSARDIEVVREEAEVYTAEEKRYLDKVLDIPRYSGIGPLYSLWFGA